MKKAYSAKIASGIPLITDRLAVDYLKSIWTSNIGTHESIFLLMLTPSYQVCAYECINVGGVNSCPINLNNTMAAALKNNAYTILLAHNHPSGSPNPSKADLAVTKDLQLRCKCVDIELYDHIIITPATSYFSFKASGLINDYSRENARIFNITDPSSYECKALQIIDAAFKERLQGVNTAYITRKVNSYLDRLFIKYYDPITIDNGRL